MNYSQDITLNINTHDASKIFPAKQFDSERIIIVKLMKDGEQYIPVSGITASYRIHKPDHTGVWNPAIILDSGYIQVNLTANDLAAAGRAYADILLTKNGDTLSSTTFVIDIQARPDYTEQVESTSEYHELEEILQNSQTIINNAQAWAEGKHGTTEVTDDSYTFTLTDISASFENFETFKTNITPKAYGEEKTYVFTYDSTKGKWIYDSNVIDDIRTLYGISVSGTPSATSVISIKATFKEAQFQNNAKYYSTQITNKENIFRYEIMPEPSSNYSGKVVQYIGETGDYIKGYFYICELSESVYVWKPINISSGIPAGGTVAQVLTKNSSTDYDAEWKEIPKENYFVSYIVGVASDSFYQIKQAYTNGKLVVCNYMETSTSNNIWLYFENLATENSVEIITFGKVIKVNNNTKYIQLAVNANNVWTKTELNVLNEHQDITGKQNVISDLETIRSGAAAGATAVQPAAISDMATKTWVEDKTYATETWVENKSYATQSWSQTKLDEKITSPTTGNVDQYLKKTSTGVAWADVNQDDPDNFIKTAVVSDQKLTLTDQDDIPINFDLTSAFNAKQKKITQSDEAPDLPSEGDYWDDTDESMSLVNIDGTVTQGSTNPVSSNAVYNALTEKINNPSDSTQIGYVLKKSSSGTEWGPDNSYSNIFIANKDITTFYEIMTAVNDGKQILCKVGNKCFTINSYSSDENLVEFINTNLLSDGTINIEKVSLSNDVWSSITTITVEKNSNKETSLSESNIKYPTSQAVLDALDDKIDMPSSYVTTGKVLKKTDSGVGWQDEAAINENYLKNASVYNNQLTLVNRDNSVIRYNPMEGAGCAKSVTKTLEASSWVDNTYNLYIEEVTSTDQIIVCSGHPNTISYYYTHGIYCYEQGLYYLTFKCETTPTVDIDVNILIMELIV